MYNMHNTTHARTTSMAPSTACAACLAHERCTQHSTRLASLTCCLRLELVVLHLRDERHQARQHWRADAATSLGGAPASTTQAPCIGGRVALAGSSADSGAAAAAGGMCAGERRCTGEADGLGPACSAAEGPQRLRGWGAKWGQGPPLDESVEGWGIRRGRQMEGGELCK